MIPAASAQPTPARARAPPTPRSCCACGCPPIRRPLHESDDPNGIVHRDLRLTLLIFQSGLSCSHKGLRFIIVHQPLTAVLLPTCIGTNLASQLDEHRAPRKLDCRHFVSPVRAHRTEPYCGDELRRKVYGDRCDRETGSLFGEEHGDATKLPVGTRFTNVGALMDAGVRNGWRHPPVYAVARGECARRSVAPAM